MLQNTNEYSNLDVELHIFVDSCKNCSAAEAYLRIHNRIYDSVECSLVASKTRVAPLKLISIPRLELTAAIMGSRMGTTIRNSLTLMISRSVYWCDSKTVLSWIRSDARKIKGQFVAFRIPEIQDTTKMNEWRYVPSNLNVADDATKWSKKIVVNIDGRWFKGPEFLYRPESEWPTDVTLKFKTNEEIVLERTFRREKSSSIIDFDRFSKWKHLLRVVAYVLRYCYNLKASVKNEKLTCGILTSEELLEAEQMIFRTVQLEFYASEYLQIDSQIYKMSPYIDENGIIRAKGRIDAATCVSFEIKRPIILPHQSRVTRLIVENYHQRFLHIHHETVLNEIRQKFMISSCCRLLKIIWSNCPRCIYLSAKPAVPEMAPLPYARLAAYLHPFTHVGIDCMGPIEVYVGRKCEKRWICLFTCLTIRAIHLEVLHGLDSDTFIMTF